MYIPVYKQLTGFYGDHLQKGTENRRYTRDKPAVIYQKHRP